eukprot:gene6356-10362_t
MSRIDEYEVIRRNYEQFFMVDIKDVPFSDQYIHKHVNGLTVIGLAKTHAIFKLKNIKITSLKFKQEVIVKGKKKQGSVAVRPNSVICEIFYKTEEQKEDEEPLKFNVFGCIKGKAIEFNMKLEQNPTLLFEKTETDGFFAIVDTRLTNNTQAKVDYKYEHLLSLEQFQKVRNEN